MSDKKILTSPVGSRFRFRTAPRPKPTFDFAPDQKWVGSRRKRRLTYVDMTPQVAAASDSAPKSRAGKKKQPAIGLSSPEESASSSTNLSTVHIPSHVEYGTQPLEHAEQDPGLASRCRYPPGPLYGMSETYSDSSYLDFHEAFLLRHFIENLAPLFDTSDIDRHFAIAVPERAVLCPVLRYAVYTASSGHLIRLACCRGESRDTVSLYSMGVPDLSPDTAIRYHDICIAHLIEISKDPKEEYNEDVLTAATILRFYEQIDAPAIGPSEAYLNAIQFIVNTQKDESFYAYQTIGGPPRDSSVHVTPSISLRHSACLAALRQEIWSAFLNQRPFRLPVSPYNDYSLCDPNNDFIRANRIFVWVADLLVFSFGENTFTTAQEKVQRWGMLKAVEQKWQGTRPPPLRPLYYRERDPSSGRFFPEIWYTNACQVAGAQHVELGRILLAVSDPTSTTRLGIGAISRNYALAAELRNITRRLCGLALSNKKCPSAMITAMVAIAVCGEYFTDPAEQDALLRLLRDLEYEYAWPTQSTVAALRASWGQNCAT
ncbi:hypothetical protein BDW62DRAFT_213056 [Aspergillus aurantiobrunneus]